MKKKIVLGVAVVLVVSIIILSIVIASLVNSDALGKTLLAQASKATGLRLTAEEFDLGLFSGLEMAGVVAEGESSAGKYRVEVKRLVFKHRLWPLLSGTLAIDKIFLDEPDVLLISGTTGRTARVARPEPAIEEGTTASEGWGFRLEVAEIEVTDGRIRLQAQRRAKTPEDRLMIKGLRSTLKSIEFDPEPQRPVRRLSGTGTIAAEHVLLGELPIRNLEAQVRAGGGVFELTGLSLSMDPGDLQANLKMDLNPVPFQYEFSAQGDPINVNQIVGLGPDGSLGPGRLTLKGHGRGPQSRNLKAGGVLHLDNGQVPSHPILKQAQDLVGIEHLIGGEYKATDTNLEVSNDRVNVDQFALETAAAGVDIDGWADLEGPLQMRIGLRAPREGLSIPKVPPVVLDTLADEKGWVTVPLLVTGTRENPRVALDMDALTSQGSKGAVRTLMNLIGGGRQ